MSLFICPECGTRISETARFCPHCGYTGEKPSSALAIQGGAEAISVDYRIEPWKADSGLAKLPEEDQRSLVKFLVDRGGLEKVFPAVAENIRHLVGSDTQYVAKLTPHIRKLLNEGKLRFQYDRNGELMAVLRDGKEQVFRKQVRLEEVVGDAGAAQALNNLATMAILNQVLDEVKEVRKAIYDLHVELQNDRIAYADSAWDKLSQAQVIRDSRPRENAIINAISSATDAKHLLMRNFEQEMRKIRADSDKGVLDFIKTSTPNAAKEARLRSADAIDDVARIMRAAQVECVGWSMLGSLDASREALKSLRSFIVANELSDGDTLLLINESAADGRKDIAMGLAATAKKISALEDGDAEKRLIEGRGENDQISLES